MVRYETSYLICTLSAYITASQAYFSKRNPLLENLLTNCKVLNVSFSKKQKQSKETNGKQKFQKL